MELSTLNTDCAILYLDDEFKSLKYFKAAFEDIAPIYIAENVTEGYRILEENHDHIGIFIADQRMPGEKGIRILEKARSLSPDTLRILVTAYSDLNTAVNAVNNSRVYAYITKPWDVSQLEKTLTDALDYYVFQKNRSSIFQKLQEFKQGIINHERADAAQHIVDSFLHEFKRNMGYFRLLVHALKEKRPEELKEQIDALLSRVKTTEYFLKNYKTPGCLDYHFKETDLVSYLQRCLKIISPLKNQRVKIITEFPPPEQKVKVYLDQDKFRNVIHVIVDNAFDAMKDEGEFKLTVTESNNKACIKFEDNGVGMSKETRNNIGMPKFSTKEEKGRGFGLFSSLSVIRKHNGILDIESQEGIGSVFTIALPIIKSVRLS